MTAEEAVQAVDPPEGRAHMPREKRPENSVGLRLDLSTSHRDRLMVAAAKRGQSMAACLRQVVSEWVDRVEPEVPKQPKAKKTKEDPE